MQRFKSAGWALLLAATGTLAVAQTATPSADTGAKAKSTEAATPGMKPQVQEAKIKSHSNSTNNRESQAATEGTKPQEQVAKIKSHSNSSNNREAQAATEGTKPQENKIKSHSNSTNNKQSSEQ